MDELEVVPLDNTETSAHYVDEDATNGLHLEPFSTDLTEHDEYPMLATASRASIARARFQANPVVRVARRLARNALNKLEDIGIGIVGVTEGIAEAGEGVGRTAVSGVGAVGSAVEAGVLSAVRGHGVDSAVPAREVDTITEVDISGTILKDLNRAIEEEQLKGTSNAESPLNTPWILMIAPCSQLYLCTPRPSCLFVSPPLSRLLLRFGSLSAGGYGSVSQFRQY